MVRMTKDHDRRIGLLRRFQPLADIAWEDLSSLARTSREVSIPTGRPLVRPPRRLSGWWYLVAGTLVDEETGREISAGSGRARTRVYPGLRALRVRRRAHLLVVDAAAGRLHLSAAHAQVGDSTGAATDWLSVLAASPLLRALYRHAGGGAWQDWVARLRLRRARPDSVIFAAGERADSFYVVKRGYVRVDSPSGPRLVGPGGFFGEDGVISGQPRNARVLAPHGAELMRGSADELLILGESVLRQLVFAPPIHAPLARLDCVGSTSDLRRDIDALPPGSAVGLPAPSEGLGELAMLVLFHRSHPVVLMPDSLLVRPPEEERVVSH